MPGPLRQVLRPRHGPAGRGRPGHGRPPRHVRAGLPGQVLRGHRLSRPHQLHRQLQRCADPVRRSPRARAGRRSTSSTTPRSTRNMQLVFDEPWSRPGDYVMLRAMTDLVCASSACPDDIDPSNAWEVTDVHVRVYSPQNRFSVAIARRVTADAAPVLTQRDRIPPAHQRADQELPRIPRLLAAPLLQQRGRDRRVLGLPREGRR